MKRVVITGASSSIGRPLTRLLLQKGYTVLAHFRRENDELMSLKSGAGSRLQLLEGDFSTLEGIESFVSQLGNFMPVFAVIHTPSPEISLKPLVNVDWYEYEHHLNIQVRSLQQIVNKTIKPMKSSGVGYVISIGSDIVTSDVPPKGYTAYAVAKAALSQFLRCLDAEFGENGINTHQLHPTMFRSPLLAQLPEYVIEQALLKSEYDMVSKPQEKIAWVVAELLAGKVSRQHEVQI